jgi:4-amino-4-deoxy-L-arabinose transferase-like glycosyltransferase
MSPRREIVVLALACLVAYGTGLGDVAFYTRGEPREGLVVREMLRSGEWLVPRRPEGEVARKPPLYYWLAAPVAAILPGRTELALRLPSALAATAAVLGTWGAARAAAGPAAALPAALVLATAFEWTRAATSARVDMSLAAALTLVLVAWLVVLAGGRRRWLAGAIAGAILATLAKGPVGLALPALAAIAYAAWRRDTAAFRRLGVVPVLAVAAIAAGAWYLVAFAEQGRAFLDVVLKENVVRFIDTDDARTGHAHGLLYLPLLGLVGVLPWVPLLPLAIGARRDTPAPSFAALWAVVVVAFFSLANAKRSVYLLPAFPALAICIGAGAAAGGRPLARRLAVTYLPALATLGALALALAAGFDPGVLLAPWLRADDAHGASAIAAAVARSAPLVALLGVATLAGAVVIERARRSDAWPRLVVAVAVLMIAWTAVFDAAIHPAIARTRSLREFMTTVDRLVPRDATLAASFPVDPGLRFYAPRPLVRFDLAGSDAPRWLLLWEDEWRRLRDPRGDPLPVVSVSAARQSRRGALALVLAPPGAIQRAPSVPDAPRPPGLHAGPR